MTVAEAQLVMLMLSLVGAVMLGFGLMVAFLEWRCFR